MMRVFAVIGFLTGSAFGQSTAIRPVFDITDVHPSVPVAHPTLHGLQGGVLRAGRYELRNATMLDLVRIAYAIDADLVMGGPGWLEWDRFDVIAKAPVSTSKDKVRLMLQALLVDRFKLAVHKDTKPRPAFALSAGSGKPKLREADGSGETGCQPSQPPLKPPAGRVQINAISCRNITTEMLASTLRGMAPDYLTSPVVDQTGLKGSWDFDFKWTPKGLLAIAGADGISFFDAIDKQLGLKLEPHEIPVPAIVVDSVNQKPTPNAPEVATILPPPPPPKFEVASIRPTAPGASFGGPGLLPGGRFDRRGSSLVYLILQAWDLDLSAELVGAPKWLNLSQPVFDIIAKAPDTTITGGTQFYDNDDLQLMLRALLVDRFKMAFHYEDRLNDAYSLVAAKPKLKRADPSNRAGCKESQAVTGPGDAGPPPRVVNCLDVTMAQFAERLQGIASRSMLHYPVLDATGIEGAWDFTLTFNPTLPPGAGLARPDGDVAQPGGAPVAADPIGGLSLFDALNRQLGLKLEVHKRLEPVFVIDHIEERPTEN